MRPSRITIHHTATPSDSSLAAIRSNHMASRGWSDIGYHWVIEKDVDGTYKAVMGRPMYRTGAHALRHNTNNIGVAVIGDFSTTDPPFEQLALTAELVATLCVATGIRVHNIIAHRDLRPTLCPGRFPIELLRRMVTSLRSGRWPRARHVPWVRGLLE